jgi:hypothetical protein
MYLMLTYACERAWDSSDSPLATLRFLVNG